MFHIYTLMSSLPTDARVHQRGDWYNRLPSRYANGRVEANYL